MLEFPGNTFGLALNLERDSVGAVVLGEYEHIKEGDNRQGRRAHSRRCRSVANGSRSRGQRALGEPVDGRARSTRR